MSELSFTIDVETAHAIATAYLERRKARIAEKQEKYVDDEYRRQLKKWFGKPKTRDEVRDQLKNTDEWELISINGVYQANRMFDLAVACSGAMVSGVTTIVLSGDTANDVSWEIVSNNALGVLDA